MTLDGTYTAVLDRFEDDLAVLELTDEDGETHERVVDSATLPEAGRHVDAVLDVAVTDGVLETAEYDETETATRTETAQDRFDRLSARPPSDDDE